MKLKRLVSVFLAASLACGLAACGSSNAEAGGISDDAIILKYAEVNSIDSLDGLVASYFKDQVEKLTNGSVVIDVQASGVLGDESTVLDGMTAHGGTVDLARISCFALTNYGAKLSALPSIPFTFNDREHYWTFTESEIGQKILDEPSELGLGVQGLFFLEEGFRNFFVTEEFSSIEDMAGRKIRVSSDPILTSVVEELGANPTVISFGELYTSLQSGVVDGADQPTALYESNAFNEVAPYLIEDGHTMSASEVIVSEDSWAKLNDEQKNAIEEACVATSAYAKEISASIEEECKTRLEDKGVTFVPVEDKQPWRDACSEVISEYTSGLENEYQQILDLA